MTRGIHILYILSATLITLFGSCYHGYHALCDPEYDSELAGYLSIELRWDEADDAFSTIDDVRITISDGGNVLKNKHFYSPIAVAEYVQHLPEGNYDVLAAVDMSEKNGYVLTTNNTKNTQNNLPETVVSFKDVDAKHPKSWFAVANATVTDGRLTVAQLSLKRLLASLSVIIHGMPQGSEAGISILHSAQSVELASLTVSDEESAAISASLPVEKLLLMPTVASRTRTVLILNIVTPDGNIMQCTLDAPRMDIGKNYNMELDYKDLTPYMFITSTPISDWEECWTISGEIFNPDE